jgi:DNA polymerase I-like protein with 3'-5' exonuclease and polymerase domains
MRPLQPSQIPDWVKLEHQVAQILTEQELHGWYFDERAAWQLSSALRTELEETCRVLQDRHPFYPRSEFTPKANNRRYGYIAGATFTRTTELNPVSRDHIAWCLQEHYKWEPTKFTPTGKVLIDEVVLNEVAASGITIAEDFLKCLTITKKLGMISEGVNAWLKLCTTASRIHHHCSVATNTHRCAHRKPNLSQVPSDHDCRQLFKASPGQIMVGADLAGIELRMLASELAPYDGGRYADILLNGDIHQVNADRVGVSRRAIKTISYAFLYGAGNAKLGLSFDSSLKEDEAKEKGAEIRKAFVDAIDGLKDLLRDIKKESQQGYIKSIDGRPIKVDSSHKSLNYKLQSGASCVAKRWMVLANESLKDIDCHQLAFIHDELQYETHPKHAEYLSTCLLQSAKRAGEYYNLRIPIAAEAKCGNSWADVH